MAYRFGVGIHKLKKHKPKHPLLLLGVAAAILFSSAVSANSWLPPQINVWWPVFDARISGIQPLKADFPGYAVESYNMSWSVDGGQENPLYTNYEHYPHKETSIDVSNWTWRGEGPYMLTYRATALDGTELAKTDIRIYVDHGQNQKKAVTAEPAPQPVSNPETVVSSTTAVSDSTLTSASITTAQTSDSQAVEAPAAAVNLFVNPNSHPIRQAAEWQNSRPADAAVMARIGTQPQAKWFGDWNNHIESEVRAYSEAARSHNAVPVMVAYNIPQRDCGSYSAGGSGSAQSYRQWIKNFASGLGSSPAIVVLEPDAVALMDCLNNEGRTARMQLLSEAVAILKKQPAVKVYIDGGNPRWHSADEISKRLAAANVQNADGFSLNISNFFTTDENVRYGTEVSAKLKGARFVIDTSRNGAGPTQDQRWCNPADRAIGNLPTTVTGQPLVDAYLWIKAPGESDGSCNGAPSAGQWWPDYALNLARKAGW